MRNTLWLTGIVLGFLLPLCPRARGQSDGPAPAAAAPAAGAQPFDGQLFHGRIALSHDGNFNDEDDWGAFPVVIAILDAFGVKEKLVHIDFNNITNYNDSRFESEMNASVLGAAERYRIPSSVLKNCRTDLAGAIRSVTESVNASSAEDPLWYLLAGPMDVPYAGIRAADPAKRRFVYCLSHSVWNDGFGRKRPIEGCTKRDLIGLGIRWIQVRPGHLLAPSTRTSSTPKQWAMFQWMQDSSDERLRWVHSRIQAVGRADVSDATIAYSLLTGDEECDPQKLESLMEKKRKLALPGVRRTIRMEAENFGALENAAPVLAGRAASQSLSVRAAGASKGAIRNRFHEIYAARSGRHDVGIRYLDAGGGAAAFALRVNGVPQGASWTASADDNAWKTHTIESVALGEGDEIAVDITPEGGDRGEIDYVELQLRSTAPGVARPSAGPGLAAPQAGGPPQGSGERQPSRY